MFVLEISVLHSRLRGSLLSGRLHAVLMGSVVNGRRHFVGILPYFAIVGTQTSYYIAFLLLHNITGLGAF